MWYEYAISLKASNRVSVRLLVVVYDVIAAIEEDEAGKATSLRIAPIVAVGTDIVERTYRDGRIKFQIIKSLR